MGILRRFTDFILRGRTQAMGVAFVLAYIPYLGSISILVAGLVTLRRGALDGFLTFFAATLPYVLHFLMAHTAADALTEFANVAMIALIVSNGLMWLYAVMLRRYSNWGFVLDLSAVLGIVFVLVIHLINPDIQQWWADQLTDYFKKTTEMVTNLNQDKVTALTEAQAQVVLALKGYATGLLVSSVILNVLLQLGIARWWQAVMFNPGGLRPELYQIRLSHAVGVIFIIVCGLSYWLGGTLSDMVPVLYGLFCVAGLSLIHNLLSRVKGGWFWIGLVYLLTIVLFPMSLGIISVLALIDIWSNFRKRFA